MDETEIFDIHEMHSLISKGICDCDIRDIYDADKLIANMTLEEKLRYVQLDSRNIILFGGKDAPYALKAEALTTDYDCGEIYKLIDPEMKDRKFANKMAQDSSGEFIWRIVSENRFDVLDSVLSKGNALLTIGSSRFVNLAFHFNRSGLLAWRDKHRSDRLIMRMLLWACLQLGTGQFMDIGNTEPYHVVFDTDEMVLFAMSNSENKSYLEREYTPLKYEILRKLYDVDRSAYDKAYLQLSSRERRRFDVQNILLGNLSMVTLPEREILSILRKSLEETGDISRHFVSTSPALYRVKDPKNLPEFLSLFEQKNVSPFGGKSVAVALLLNNLDVAQKMKPEEILKIKLRYNI